MAEPAPGLQGERVLLRPWQQRDREAFAAMNADAQVMRHFPAPLTRRESNAAFGRIRLRLAEQGWGLWCVDVRGECAGFAGLAVPRFAPPFTHLAEPCVEIGWRLRPEYWGRGYASEAARLVLRHGFVQLGLPEIVSFTARSNVKSQAVMQRIGMQHDAAAGFLHPNIPTDHPLAPHVLYRLRRDDWCARAQGDAQRK